MTYLKVMFLGYGQTLPITNKLCRCGFMTYLKVMFLWYRTTSPSTKNHKKLLGLELLELDLLELELLELEPGA